MENEYVTSYYLRDLIKNFLLDSNFNYKKLRNDAKQELTELIVLTDATLIPQIDPQLDQDMIDKTYEALFSIADKRLAAGIIDLNHITSFVSKKLNALNAW